MPWQKTLQKYTIKQKILVIKILKTKLIALTQVHSNININEIDFVTPKEVMHAIKRSKSKKAPGLDNIKNIVLTNLPSKAFVQLTNIFNACLKFGYFPEKWKVANILAFKKLGKDKKLPQSYRPISLLPTIS